MAIALKVLIIEDSDGDAALDVLALEKSGYQVTYEVVMTATDMKAALGKQTFDLIIADHNLPQFDSSGALYILHESGQDIPFVVVSGSIGEEMAVALMKAGAHDYIMKGNLGRLGSAVARELEEMKTRSERKRAEQELNIKNALLTAIANSPKDIVIFSLDREYCYMEFNEKHKREMRNVWNADIKIGMNLLDCMAIPELREKAKQSIDHALTGVSFIEEQFQPNKNIFYELDWNPIYQEDDSIIGVTCFGRDISERKKVEKQIIRSKELLQTVIDSSPDRIAVKDSQHRYLLVNKSLANLLNVRPQEMIGKFDTDFFSQERILGNDAKGIRSIHGDDALALAGQTVRKVSKTIDEKGNPEIFDAYRIPLKDQEGNTYGVLSYNRDMTEIYSIAENLKKSYEKVQKILGETVDAIAAICEKRDPYTAGHQTRVALLAYAIAKAMGMSEEGVSHIKIGATIHDIGKIYVPAEILSKPGKLSAIEFSIIRCHSQTGYDIVRNIDFPCAVANIVLQHHERLDGSGYPNSLTGSDISNEAKIIAVADVVEAMSSHRPYRPALGIEKALDEINRNKGTLYDEKVVDICTRLFNEKQFKFV